MSFVKTYVAVIITKGDTAFIKKNGKPYLYLEGTEIAADDFTAQPKTKLIAILKKIVGFQFSQEWLHWLGISTHQASDQERFAVIHYWLDISMFDDYLIYFGEKFISVPLSELANNTEINILQSDRDAAKRLVSVREYIKKEEKQQCE